MSENLSVFKKLATLQDLALGRGKVTQIRNGESLELDEVDFIRANEVNRFAGAANECVAFGRANGTNSVVVYFNVSLLNTISDFSGTGTFLIFAYGAPGPAKLNISIADLTAGIGNGSSKLVKVFLATDATLSNGQPVELHSEVDYDFTVNEVVAP